jgi:hypothetical protein
LRQKNPKDLDASLEDYSTAVQNAADSLSLGDRLGRWPIYAAATGSALALGTSAAASIIYFSGPPVQATVSVGPGFTSSTAAISLLPFADPGLYAIHRNSSSAVRGAVGLENCGCYPALFFVTPPSPGAPGPALKNFAFNQPISYGVLPTSGPGTFLFPFGFAAARCDAGSDPCGSTASNFASAPFGPPDVTGFVGFVAYNSTDPTPLPRFGWIRIRWSADLISGFPNSIEALDWAIEDSGAALLAGDTGVPEPGTMSMALLALGAAGIVSWRKRKNAAALKTQP